MQVVGLQRRVVDGVLRTICRRRRWCRCSRCCLRRFCDFSPCLLLLVFLSLLQRFQLFSPRPPLLPPIERGGERRTEKEGGGRNSEGRTESVQLNGEQSAAFFPGVQEGAGTSILMANGGLKVKHPTQPNLQPNPIHSTQPTLIDTNANRRTRKNKEQNQ